MEYCEGERERRELGGGIKELGDVGEGREGRVVPGGGRRRLVEEVRFL